jgi:polyvinyl alcohol dehydrogenase (cytochrome)
MRILNLLGLSFSALAALGCSDKVEVHTPVETDAGAPTGPTWTNQAYDIQSTWNNTGETKLTKDNVADLSELWNAPINTDSTPTVVGDRLFVSSSAGIYALNADSGGIIWTQRGTPEKPIGTSASPTYEDGVLYIDSAYNGYVYALNAKDGKIIWSTQVSTHEQSAGYSVPIIYGNSIFLGVSSNEEVGTTKNARFKGSVVALDKRDGSILWQTPTAGDGENGCAVWSTVALDPISRTVFATTGNNYTEEAGPGSDSIFAFDMKTGDVNWHEQVTGGDVYTINNPKSGDSDFGANPVVFDYNGQHLLAAGQKSGTLYVYDRDTGTQIKSRPMGMGSAYIGGIFQALAWDGDHLYTVCNLTTSTAGGEDSNMDSATTSVLFALDPLTLDIVYERQLPAWVWSPMVLVNGMALLGAETHLEAFATEDGSKLFDFKVPGTIVGAPVVNNGRVYLTSGLSYYFGHPDGSLHALALPDDPAVGKHFDAGPPPDNDAPTFTNFYTRIIAKSCIDAQCHGSTAQGSLQMVSPIGAYSSLVNVPASGKCAGPDGGLVSSCGCGTSGKVRVVPGKPEESLLVEKLGGNPTCGDRMPPTGEPLSDDLQNLVKNWIRAGAQGS